MVVGACTGSDAHTVGIDAILNYKGFAGDKGLESYKWFEAYNLGAQVENEQLAERALALKADAVLVSQVITQRNCHKENAAAFIELASAPRLPREDGPPPRGPRIDQQARARARVRRRLRSGTKPGDVASFLVERLCAVPGAPQSERRLSARGAGRCALRGVALAAACSDAASTAAPDPSDAAADGARGQRGRGHRDGGALAATGYCDTIADGFVHSTCVVDASWPRTRRSAARSSPRRATRGTSRVTPRWRARASSLLRPRRRVAPRSPRWA
ncbi:MAG: cobalamin B12-binding domain-containing protein [Polyangiaceae bacterium]